MKREDAWTWGLRLALVGLAGWLVLGVGGPAEAQTAVRPCVAGSEVFADVPAGHPFCGFIEQLVRDAITAGCATNPPRYCPEAFVTRGQMAVFLEKVLRFREPQVTAGALHTCGLLANRRVACWGHNGFGQLTPPAGAFAQVAAGTAHTCGVRSDGTVACWGFNDDGQAMPPAGAFAQVAAGDAHTCGLRSDETVACWGRNSEGQAAPPAGAFAQVAAGGRHTCGLRSDGTVTCWGDNVDDQATPPAGAFTQIAASLAHTCGVRSDGTVACWGRNDERPGDAARGSVHADRGGPQPHLRGGERRDGGVLGGRRLRPGHAAALLPVGAETDPRRCCGATPTFPA